MVVEIQNPGVGMEEDCLNLTSACAILMSLLRMVFYILIHQTAACLHQLVLTAKARCRYNTGSLIKHHRFKSLCSTVKVRVNAPFWDISTLRRPVSSGSLSSISRDWMRAVWSSGQGRLSVVFWYQTSSPGRHSQWVGTEKPSQSPQEG